MAAVALSLTGLWNSPAWGQVLYMENFEVDPTANWTVNDGPTDEAADFFFDYSTVGIPSAPNSGGTTRGMKLQTNLIDAVFGGFSVSPNGQSFTGDYALTFDWWHNFLGAEGTGVEAGANGSTQLSQFGILTSGTVANYAGAGDGVWFAASGDGGTGSDYRAYSSERVISYQLPAVAPEDEHATYHAGSRNNTAQLYLDTFGGATVPEAQTNLFPETQFGVTADGAAGFAWHQVEIAKVGTTVTWKVNGTLLITVETAEFITPTGGTNILFGQSDINSGLSQDPYYDDVQFTLIDNVKVSTVTAPAEDADFDNDGDVDGEDFLVWQRGFGPTGTNATGDANGDNAVTAADLEVWKGKFGATPPAASVSAVPEPATVIMAVLTAAGLAAASRRRRR
ncbi:MAG: hypothetical protein DCC67_05590 [Planctomycetota bacterium]|nr:MAG: hypothetical protein DCC67_05590 [Planctomycetota bacterium]